MHKFLYRACLGEKLIIETKNYGVAMMQFQMVAKKKGASLSREVLESDIPVRYFNFEADEWLLLDEVPRVISPWKQIKEELLRTLIAISTPLKRWMPARN